MERVLQVSRPVERGAQGLPKRRSRFYELKQEVMLMELHDCLCWRRPAHWPARHVHNRLYEWAQVYEMKLRSVITQHFIYVIRVEDIERGP